MLRAGRERSEEKTEGLVLISVFWAKVSNQSLGTKLFFPPSLFLVLDVNIASLFYYFPFFKSVFSSALKFCMVVGSLYCCFPDWQRRFSFPEGKSVSELITQHACGYMTCSTAFCLLVGFDFSYHLLCVDSE